MLPARLALTTSFYAAPQKPDDAQRLFAAAAESAGLMGDIETPLRPARGYAAALLLAREWEMRDLESRLVETIDASHEPTWDTERGEFTWGMGLDEPHPRGQFNAFNAAAEAAGPGRWAAMSNQPVEACPQVVEVDFPDVAFTRAEWVDGNFYGTVKVRQPDPDRRITFRIVGAEPRLWDVHAPERTFVDVKLSGIHVSMPMVDGDLELFRGNY
ncbi:MAG: hypothetical protein AAF567_10055 [Actinomycetota bacterium]